MITIVGLGPGDQHTLPPVNFQVLKRADRLFLRTERHPVVDWLQEQGLVFETFDQYYEEAEDFDEVYHLIKERVLAAAREGDVVYAVPGHPLVAETSVALVLEEARSSELDTTVIPAMSFLDAIYAALQIDPTRGMQIVDALKREHWALNPALGTVVVQTFSSLVATDVKLDLLEIYPPGHQVVLIRAAGIPGQEKIEYLPLYTLDWISWLDHLTSVYVPPLPGGAVARVASYPLDELVEVMNRLRGPNGCPWDREQDHHTITPYLVEETYEVLEAIQQGDMYKICEELGDLLLQIVFHAQIARERGQFDINDVVDGVCQKMIRRHPHVFGDTSVQNSDEVLVNWDEIKQAERGGNSSPGASVLDGVPRGLPALPRSYKIQAKASRVGFDWPDYRGALDKLWEECRELEEALELGSVRCVKQETGDVLFAAINVARLAGVDPEIALTAAVDKFVRRFHYVEEKARESGTSLKEMSLEEMDKFWEEAKKLKKEDEM